MKTQPLPIKQACHSLRRNQNTIKGWFVRHKWKFVEVYWLIILLGCVAMYVQHRAELEQIEARYGHTK